MMDDGTLDLWKLELDHQRFGRIIGELQLGRPFAKEPGINMGPSPGAVTPSSMEAELYVLGLRGFRVEWNDVDPHRPRIIGDPERNR